MSENEYKTIKDLTQEVNEMVKYINEFPSEGNINGRNSNWISKFKSISRKTN